jgi:hypothetical protein
MSRTARILWLILSLNVAVAGGVLAYGLGNVPFNDIREPLNCFGLGALLSGMAISFAYMTGMNVPGGGPDLESAPTRVIRLVMGIVGCDVLALVVFVKGVFTTVSLITS